ncbi:hypothetical protein P775_04850 [Puniceibacterium antarcticum]|uniref:Uncharacterized protein n=1 Tax=Puniceibacterium antarcticum TaxID=1206336 RepID=A0A2G8RIE8_9RHOB|nr:hypothetical protein [Puniceibacterium antarcticum]PIL21320.1 hypothetical protein P775_04850 [Puniceibacterium antarcticum]
MSQMRGLLLDRGISITLSIRRARNAIPQILEDHANGLSAVSGKIIGDPFNFLGQINERITAIGRRFVRICGVAPKKATAVGQGQEFTTGLHLAASRCERAFGTAMELFHDSTRSATRGCSWGSANAQTDT